MTDSDGFTEIRTAAVLGLGLIGGSIARDLAARGVRVLAWDRDRAAVRSATGEGIAEPLSWDQPIDVVVVAVPVLAARDVLKSVAQVADGVRLITDAGSTKASIVQAAESLGIGDRFVGSHPLAGDHRSGWDASRTGLFADARVFLCPTSSSADEAMRLASALWTGLGARPEVMDAAEHDARLAWTSHLPQLVSSALGGVLAGQGITRAELGPGGRDVSRLAGSSPEMWADILLDNADALLPALQAAEVRLRGLRDAIQKGDHPRLRDLQAEARDWHGGGA
jgi:prephenate dehydrogenase